MNQISSSNCLFYNAAAVLVNFKVKGFYDDQSQDVLDSLNTGVKIVWDQLKASALKEKVQEVENQMIESRDFSNDCDKDQFLTDNVDILFRTFVKKFNLHEEDRIFVEPASYLCLLQEIKQESDKALKIIWNAKLIELFEFSKNPPETVSDIKHWFEDSNNENQLKKIQNLDLSSLGLKAIPPQILKFSQLRALCLHCNEIKNLPEWLGNLSKLQYLNIAKNKIKTLPVSLGNLIHLVTFFFNNNEIQSLPMSFGNLWKLKYFDLSNNRIEVFPESFANLIGLQSLDIGNNLIENLPECLGHFSNLELLNIKDNKIKYTEKS